MATSTLVSSPDLTYIVALLFAIALILFVDLVRRVFAGLF